MKTILVRTLTFTAFSIFLAATVAAQEIKNPVPAAAKVKIENNGDQKLQRITLFYKPKESDTLQPAFGNYFIPSDARALVFRIEFNKNQVKTIKYRLQVRQICSIKLTPDVSIATEQEFLAETAEDGKEPVGSGKTFELEIQLHPTPEGEVPHEPDSHCMVGDPDHLGEGPHQAFISIGEGSLNGGSDSLHVFYTKGFRTVAQEALDLMRGTEVVNFLEKRAQSPRINKKPKSRRR